MSFLSNESLLQPVQLLHREFGKILEWNEETTIESLVDKALKDEARTFLNAPSTVWSILKANLPEDTLINERALHFRINRLYNDLNSHIDEAITNQILLSRLQTFSNEVLQQGKIDLLRKKCLLWKLPTDFLYEDLDRLENKLRRIQSIKITHLKSRQHLFTPLIGGILPYSFINPFHLGIGNYKSDLSDQCNGLFKSYMTESDQEKLKPIGEELQKELGQYPPKQAANAAIGVIKTLMNNDLYKRNIPYLLSFLRTETLIFLLHDLNKEDLHRLNAILKNVKDSNEKKWIDERLSLHAQPLIDRCNDFRHPIELNIERIAKAFREDSNGGKMRFEHLAEIDLLSKQVSERIEETRKLKILLEGAIGKKETKHVLFDGILREYKVLYDQLTIKSEATPGEVRPAGCLIPIILRNVFGAADDDDDEYADGDEATSIFLDWEIQTPEQYQETGLLIGLEDGLDDNEKVIARAKRILWKLGIKTIADLKEHLIFNRHMLKEFIYREDHNEKISEILSDID